MTPNERYFKPEYAPELLRLAEEDLRAAQILFKGKARPETTLFLVQQSIEKGLKAVICAKREPVPLSHDLEVVLGKLVKESPPGGFALAELTPYATIRRYEEGHALLAEDEVQASLTAGEKILVWARKKLKEATK